MKTRTLETEQLHEVMLEIMNLYSLESSEAYSAVVRSVAEVYKAQSVLIEDDGAYAVFEEDKKEKGSLKFSKIKYSAKKSLLIISKIQEKANLCYLEKQKNKVVDFIKNKKAYLHATYSYSADGYDYYELYYDIKHEHMIRSVKGAVLSSEDKKSRVYIDSSSVRYDKGVVIFREHRQFKNLKNFNGFTKDLSSEVFEKIQLRVWIETRGVNFKKNEIYLHLPCMTTLEIIYHIKSRFFEVFGLKAVLIYIKP